MTPGPQPDIPERRPSPQDLRLVRGSIRLSRPIRPGAKPSLRLYERLWRPASFYLASRIITRTKRRRAAVALQLGRAHSLLDIGCGPGNFTEPLPRATKRPGKHREAGLPPCPLHIPRPTAGHHRRTPT
ncbi:Protein of unknown function, possible methyltransferase fragment [Mycobacterium canettii CIPT 140070010]|nr:Protein of unknown function, possible methyltransferase fragment [Mycobacterium canettii CIPT 140070010]